NGASVSTSAERLYTRRVLPRGMARGLRDSLRGDMSGGLRSIVIAAGFCFAAVGFVVERGAGITRRQDAPRARAPRILVDQSGYDLLNVGDVAMLQSCVLRLWRLWPDAEIMVICHSPGRLA